MPGKKSKYELAAESEVCSFVKNLVVCHVLFPKLQGALISCSVDSNPQIVSLTYWVKSIVNEKTCPGFKGSALEREVRFILIRHFVFLGI